jgi:hypothetical protein
MKWTDEPIDLTVWKRVQGNPFADDDPADGIALWSLWEMPSCAVGKVVRRGPPGEDPRQCEAFDYPSKPGNASRKKPARQRRRSTRSSRSASDEAPSRVSWSAGYLQSQTAFRPVSVPLNVIQVLDFVSFEFCTAIIVKVAAPLANVKSFKAWGFVLS